MSEWLETSRGWLRCSDIEEIFVERDTSIAPGGDAWAVSG